jgi:hypothetical protein
LLIVGEKMKKAHDIDGRHLAAILVSGSAFALHGGSTKTLEAPVATANVNCAPHHRAHRHRYHTQCCGYHSLYTYTTPCGGWADGGCGGFFGGRFGW